MKRCIGALCLITILCFGCSVSVQGQEQPKAILHDEFGLLCSEELMARYDSFLGALSDNPNALGMIILHGDKTSEGRNRNLFRYLKDFYPQVRQFKSENLTFVRAANGDETKVQFWLVPGGAEMPVVEPHRTFPITGTTRYDVSGGDFHRYGGKTYLYYDGMYRLGCEFAPDHAGFTDHLRKDKSLSGYIVVYTKFGTGVRYGRRIARFALNELGRSNPLRPRMKTLYGGNRNKPEIELWLVPKGGNPPSLKPDADVRPGDR